MEALKFPTEMLNVLEWPVSFLVEPLQTTFNQVMCIFRGEEVPKKEKNSKLSYLIVNKDKESVDKQDREARTAK